MIIDFFLLYPGAIILFFGFGLKEVAEFRKNGNFPQELTLLIGR